MAHTPAPDLDAVVDIVPALDVVDVRAAADAAEGQAVQLVSEADHAAAVAQGQVADRATVVVVVTLPLP